MDSSSSSSSSSMRRWEYDVFLSFHGDDTRKTFVSCLYSALSEFRTFIDDKELERGKSISPELVKKINESRIAVIVFSENYASSSWCLDELVEILECRKNKKQIVLPLFYDVKPSDVKKQTGKFGEAFTRKHEGIHTAERWRTALKEAAEISGFDLDDAANGYWGDFIKQIIQHISRNLPHRVLFKVAEHQVGIDSRANKLIMLLNETSNDKPFVGIWGTGGIGKTTVVKAVFNRIKNEFEGSCFLENVREQLTTERGLAKLQEKILRVTPMNRNVKISNPGMGVNKIRNTLHNKKILLVLDDVDDDNQLLNLVGIGHNWFGSGSRIIVATRNKWVLKKCDAKICEAKLLDDNEALELFCLHAFKKKCPEADFLDLSNRVKDYAQNLPLALRVLGSHLCQRSKADWESELDKWMRNPPKEVQDVLKISFNGLHEVERSIFLDIACFFKEYDINIAMDSFESSKSLSEPRIKVLIERSLVTISKCSRFLMHDLIQEMGREIVRQESKDPAKRSRLWSYEDIFKVFDGDTVPKNIEGIMLTEVSEEGFSVDPDVLLKMKNLRILIITTDVKLLGCPKFLPNQLRCFQWNAYPGECLPPLPKSLVRLELARSYINRISQDKNIHRNLKVINFSYCKNLVETLNFYELPCLEELDLYDCESVVAVEFHHMMKNLKIINLGWCQNLKKIPDLYQLPCLKHLYLQHCDSLVDPSFEVHEMLVKLNFWYCFNMKSLPTRINLKSLISLNFKFCGKLEKFSEINGDMKCLKKLSLRRTAIEELPPSFMHVKGLERLFLDRCKMFEWLPNNIGEMKGFKGTSLGKNCN